MTFDGDSGETIAYNYLGLPRKITSTGGTLAKYSYLASGSKTGAENGSGAGLVYRGSLIYKKASNGTLTFDGTNIPEGRLLSGATRLYVTDHLGSVKAVVNGNNGNLYEVNNYTVYGKRSANSSANSYISTAPTGEKFRQHFTGKEDQAPDFTVPFTDFGARQYSPALRRWLVPDPLSEKYYGISPYAYCAGDPVNLVDPDGRDWFYYSPDGKSNPTWNWRDEEEYHTGKYDSNGKEIILKGAKAVAVFNGARYEHLGEGDNINGIGGLNASIVLYGPGGPQDIQYLSGYTMTSNASLYVPISEGIYDCYYMDPGKSGVLSSHWALNGGGVVPTIDNLPNTSPFANQNYGLSQKTGIYIHRTNNNGYAGSTVSTGCLLVAPTDWSIFNKTVEGLASFKVQVIRGAVREIMGVTGPTGIYYHQTIK